MPPYPRNTEVYNPQTQPPTVVAGVNQHGSISISLFHWMLNTVLDSNIAWVLYRANEVLKPVDNGLDPNDTNILPVGKYVILTPDRQFLEVKSTNEIFRSRIFSLDTSGTSPEAEFRDRVRARDARCCITQDLVYSGRFIAVRATHIFPVAHKDVWDKLKLHQYIEDDVPEKQQGPNSINSIQNGLLLRLDIHNLFDDYDLGINVDEGYRIHDFSPGGGHDGRILWINEQVEQKYRPSKQLLREHFRQCVLANVKGIGRCSEDSMDLEEEHDLRNFEVWGKGVNGGQKTRLELEVASRLYCRAQPFEEKKA